MHKNKKCVMFFVNSINCSLKRQTPTFLVGLTAVYLRNAKFNPLHTKTFFYKYTYRTKINAYWKPGHLVTNCFRTFVLKSHRYEKIIRDNFCYLWYSYGFVCNSSLLTGEFQNFLLQLIFLNGLIFGTC